MRLLWMIVGSLSMGVAGYLAVWLAMGAWSEVSGRGLWIGGAEILDWAAWVLLALVLFVAVLFLWAGLYALRRSKKPAA